MIALPEVFTASVTALRRNKTRSMLTALGIIIGVAAVIAAFAVGAGANKSIDEQISSFGSNFIMVFPDRSSRSTMGSRSYLTDEDAEAIAREVSGIDAVAPMINLSATVVYENTNWDTSVVGSTADYSYVQDWSIAYGRDINQSDVRQGAKVIVIGSTVEEKLFPDTSALGKSIRVNKIPFTVIGVFEAKGLSAMGSDQDDFMLVPITAAQRRLVRWREAGRIGNIYIKGVSMTALNYIQNETEALLRERHRIMPGEPDDFAVRNVSQMLEARRKTTIMLVSVTERTREIGIRMAVGATERDIRMQFLIEAVVLSMVGGTLGIIVGVVAGYALSTFTAAPPVFTLVSIMLAFVFSAMVGVGFGYYPAYKASLLNPIDALKYE